jgi:hypothetical protein
MDKNKIEGKTTWRKDIQEVVNVFYNTFQPRGLSSMFIRKTVIMFCQRLPDGEVLEAMKKACDRLTAEEFDRDNIEELSNRAEQCIRYFCGICWRKIGESVPQSIIVEEGNKKEVTP